MQELSPQFDRAVENVQISGTKLDQVIAAHKEVRSLLESDKTLQGWGIDTILIGSYARHTARYPGKDVDVFLRFTNLSTEADPRAVYAEVDRVLVDRYGLKDDGGRVTRQDRSLNVEFPTPNDQEDLAFSVDAVPAVPFGSNWGIPNRQPDQWSDRTVRWIETNPVEFAKRSEDLSTSDISPTVGTRNAYKPVMRLLRQVRHEHLGKNRPGGLFVEIAAYYAWSNQEVEGSAWAPLLASTLESVAKAFASAMTEGLPDPVLGTPLKPELSDSQWAHAAGVFSALASKAQQALDTDLCMAAKLWREILGTNDRGPILPLPPGCDATGFALVGASAITSLGSSSARGFASESK
jgi:hypothetical protein